MSSMKYGKKAAASPSKGMARATTAKSTMAQTGRHGKAVTSGKDARVTRC